ncbi:MAG: TolB family protein [Acidobacteriota bacterium]
MAKAWVWALVFSGLAAGQPVGQFQNAVDVGVTPRAGAAAFESGQYRITGGGANIWGAEDAFRFVFSRVSGDVTLTADVRFEGSGAVEHRKAVLMVRQSLDAGSPYADVALHGDGLTSLQYRLAAGGETAEVQSALKGPARVRIERRGNRFTMYAGEPGGALTPSGPVEVKLQDPVYVGLGVCSHDANVLETAVFSNVQVETPEPPVRSKISIFDMKTKTARVIFQADRLFEAPNWSRDGKYLLVNSDGKLFRLPVEGGEPAVVEMSNIGAANNDHGISPDGRSYAISAQKRREPSKIWVMPVAGGNAKLVTESAPSYYHGWSPDGKWLAYCAERENNFDLYRIAAEGGAEQRLTSHPGYDDGPDYSPDGKWIYFNSDRSGSWDIWRVPVDGAGPEDRKAERITSDEYEDWFPHPSPDGKRMVFLSFKKGTEGHPPNQDILLRAMPLPPNAKKITVLTRLFGGQGTLNVNSWSPDSKKFAFVSYELIGK